MQMDSMQYSPTKKIEVLTSNSLRNVIMDYEFMCAR